MLIPEAIPECRASAAASTVAVTGATTSVSPSAEDDHRREHARHVAVARLDPRHQQEPGGDHQRPDRQRDPRADPLGKCARARAENRSISRVTGSDAAPAAIGE